MTTLPITPIVTASIPSLSKREMHDVDTKTPELARASLGPSAEVRTVSETSDYAEAYETFWALGQDWWKQLYDGKYHKFGPEVFDKGLHEREVEPGFYKDALKACKWISERDQLTASPTVELYKHLHEIACQHFDGKSTLVASDKVGRFYTNKGKNCVVTFVDFFRTSSEIEQMRKANEEYSEYLKYDWSIKAICAMEGDDIEWLSTYFPGKSKKELLLNLKKASEWHELLTSQCLEKVKIINTYIEKRSKDLGISRQVAVLIRIGGMIHCLYDCITDELERATAALFDEYNKNMSKATTKEEKLRLIADLFQMLEWLHPFPDGQGRTDLIILMKELCKHGFTPAILDEPYVSSFCTLDEWVDYLKKGMEKWQKLAAQKTSERMYIPV
jgi:hypothetical protein